MLLRLAGLSAGNLTSSLGNYSNAEAGRAGEANFSKKTRETVGLLNDHLNPAIFFFLDIIRGFDQKVLFTV